MTDIEWAELSINPIQDKRKGESGRGYHCTKCSPECLRCYAEVINNRFGNHQPFDDTPVEFEIVWKVLYNLKKRRKPALVFVESMGDLYHRDVTNVQIFSIYNALREIPQHRYVFLTKRAQRMNTVSDRYCYLNGLTELPDNWIGMVTAGTQESADKRIPWVIDSKFQVTGVSAEPLLEEINLDQYLGDLCWIIVGAETGPGARLMKPQWARGIRKQCTQYGTSFFMKKMSGSAPIPDDLMIRQFPT